MRIWSVIVLIGLLAACAGVPLTPEPAAEATAATNTAATTASATTTAAPVSASMPTTGAFRASRYQLYYGHDAAELARIQRELQRFDVIILDTRKLPAISRKSLLIAAEHKQARVLGYLSIGELDSREKARFDAFLASLPDDERTPFEQIAFEWNDKFASWRVDVSAPAWQLWLRQQADQLSAQGLHGLFLDTPDTVDRYLTHPDWTRAQKIEKTQAMRDLIRSFKAKRPQDYILLNRGLNLIGDAIWLNEDGSDTVAGLALMQPSLGNPDAVLYENAYASSDPWTQRIEADLRATASAGFTQVFTLGYRDTIGDPALFYRRNDTDGFIGSFAESSTSLHQHGTEARPSPQTSQP